MEKIMTWYKNLKLSPRIILSMNVAVFLSILLISVLATINRQRIQFQDARAIASNEINQITTLFSFAKERKLDEFGDVIKTKSIYNTGYISIIKSNGDVIICRKRENMNLSGTLFFQSMRGKQKGESTYIDPVSGEINYQFFEYFKPLDVFIVITLERKEFIVKPVFNTLRILLFALVFTLAVFSLVNFLIMKSITRPVNGLIKIVKQLGKGDLPAKYDYTYGDEVGQMSQSVNELVDGLKKTAQFAIEIGKNNFDYPFTPLSQADELGNALLDMRHSLKTASDEEKIRKAEDEKRTWTTQGLALFGDILRQNNDNLHELSYNIISNLVDYLKINQGGIFILNEDDKESGRENYLELTACYAFDRRKFLEKKIKIGEGLVGTCFVEKESIYLTSIPQNYIRITSGLGDENPGSLLLVPLRLNEKIFGVIELASFYPFEKHQMVFVEKIGESIASTISSVKINSQTAMLLQKSQQQAEEMKAQEEEMRQNMEELTATQESMAEKERENLQTIASLEEQNNVNLISIVARENELLDTLENCPDAVVKSDQLGNIIFFNKAAEKLWDYNQTEVLGKNIKYLMPDIYSGEHDDYMKNYFSTGQKKIIGYGKSVEIKRKSGKLSPVFLNIVETKVEQNKYYTAFFRELNVVPSPAYDLLAADSGKEEILNEPITPPTKKTPVRKKPADKGAGKDNDIGDLHKSEDTDIQKAWAQHMDQKGKQFKKGRKK